MRYTNNTGIPLALGVFLATDDYDYQENTISTTTVIRPIRQIILSQRINQEDSFIDISSMIQARMGSAIHTAIEKAWLNPSKALKALGYTDKIINKIKINPDTPNPKDINVYMEQRAYKQVDGITISGKFDFVSEGIVQDFKSTSVATYLNQSNKDKYILQGSIYRWLNPDIITQDYMQIHFIFTDWNKLQAMKDKEYPHQRVLSQKLPLLSIPQTQQYIESKVALINKHINTPECDLPLCEDTDLWRKPTVYKYFKNPEASRSTKNFDDYTSAIRFMSENNNVGIVKEVKGQVLACKYCPAFALCSQKDALISTGDLVL